MDQRALGFTCGYGENLEEADPPFSSFSSGSSTDQPVFPAVQLEMVDFGAEISQQTIDAMGFASATFVDTSVMATAPSPFLLGFQDWYAPPADNAYGGFHTGIGVPGIPDPVSGNSLNLQGWTSSPDTTPSPAYMHRSQAGMKPCPHCDHQTRYGKDLRRHVVEIHEKPLPGEQKIGWYQCRCKKVDCGARKSNYKRHLETCKSSKWGLHSFLCQCGQDHTDKCEHVAHIEQCRVGRRLAGRPRSE